MVTFKTTLIRADEHGFKWIVSINGQDFEYFQGVGYGKTKRTSGDDTQLVSSASRELKIAVLKSQRPFAKLTAHDVDTCHAVFVQTPTKEEVLECLFMDAAAGSDTFADFCANTGCDEDSRSAFKTYEACIENRSKLQRALGPEYEKLRIQIEERQ